ncbi:MAG: hypothetical protein QOF14_2841 [Hyphomicrobiales bacterium]|nr:hypothetical protein [Hyphomicrobiales bacterium]
MSSDETPKIEPKIELTVMDAPSIAPEAKPEAAEIVAPKTEPEAVRPEALKVEAAVEAPKLEAPMIEAEKIEPKLEAPTLPPAPQLTEPPTAVIPFKRPEPKADAPQARSRFALLAACVAIAASFGALGGSLGVATFGPMIAAPPPPVAAVTRDNVADEVKALKETVGQLRGATKSLSDNLGALKTSVTTSSTAQNTQIGKIAETLDRVEKTQGEQKKMAAHAAPDITGSIPQKQATSMVLGDPPTTLKPPIVQDYVLRRVYDGAALIEGRNGIIEVEAGETAPGLGRIEAIKRQDGRWVVVTARGLVVGR